MASDYHDYVIRDGQFIGAFEEMYRNVADPWHQSSQPNPYSRMAGILHIQRTGARSVLECGSGLGYFADQVHRATGIVPQGIDVSPTAVEKARTNFPHLRFEVSRVPDDLPKYAGADLVLFAELVWYILPELERTVQLLRQHFQGGYLVVDQVFYKGSQRYGTEYFRDLEGFQRFMGLPVVASCHATAADEPTIETSTLFRIP